MGHGGSCRSRSRSIIGHPFWRSSYPLHASRAGGPRAVMRKRYGRIFRYACAVHGTRTRVCTHVDLLNINRSKFTRGVLVKNTSGLAPRRAFLGSTWNYSMSRTWGRNPIAKNCDMAEWLAIQNNSSCKRSDSEQQLLPTTCISSENPPLNNSRAAARPPLEYDARWVS